jgi:DNA repair protein RecO (recombination protein O)
MLKKTTGLVISYLRYGDTSIIVKIFTKNLGLKSYIVNGVRSSGAKNKIALYQPLTLLELVVYDKENANLNRISETKIQHAFQRIPFDVVRSGVAMFVGEVLSKSIYDNYHNEELYDFISQSVWLLDQEDVKLVHFPLAFLIGLSGYLGFVPEDPDEFFKELGLPPSSGDKLEQEKNYLRSLLRTGYNCEEYFGNQPRKNLLDYFLLYYSKHLESVDTWKSLKVLRQIWV